MTHQRAVEPEEEASSPGVLTHVPAELLEGRLERLGEGVGKVVYASRRWVVKRERSPFDVVALIVLWRLLRRLERLLPWGIGTWLTRRPAKQIRFLRVALQAVLLVAPKGLWFKAHVKDFWKLYRSRARRGENLARARLAGTSLVPECITFPPVRVRIGGWPGSLMVSEATERVETTFDQRLVELGRAGRFQELEHWLQRFLELRQAGWRRGLFSVDAHLKNFGVIEDRVVLLDPGGLTNRWSEIEDRLAYEDVVAQPHIQLGLGPVLAARPDIAERFDEQWKAIVNRDGVLRHWPDEPDTMRSPSAPQAAH